MHSTSLRQTWWASWNVLGGIWRDVVWRFSLSISFLVIHKQFLHSIRRFVDLFAVRGSLDWN